MLEREVRRDVIARFRRTVERHELPSIGEDPFQGLINVGIRELAHWLLDLQALPLRHFELRADLQIEFERHGAFLGHFHGIHIEIGLADGRKVVIVVDLRKAIHQQFALDAAGDLFAEAVLDQFPRRVARAEAGHVRLRHQFAILFVQVAINVLARHGHGNVPLTGAAIGNLNVQIQLRAFFLALLAFIGDRLVSDELFGFQRPRASQGFFVVLIFVCHNIPPPAK